MHFGFAFFAAIALFGERVLKRETMGWGDVWLLAGIGAWLGWQALFPVILLSALQGSIVGSVMLLVAPRTEEPEKQKENEKHNESDSDSDWVPPKHAVPYGPFLSLAALEHLLAGHRLGAVWDFLLRRLFG